MDKPTFYGETLDEEDSQVVVVPPTVFYCSNGLVTNSQRAVCSDVGRNNVEDGSRLNHEES